MPYLALHFPREQATEGPSLPGEMTPGTREWPLFFHWNFMFCFYLHFNFSICYRQIV